MLVCWNTLVYWDADTGVSGHASVLEYIGLIQVCLGMLVCWNTLVYWDADTGVSGHASVLEHTGVLGRRYRCIWTC